MHIASCNVASEFQPCMSRLLLIPVGAMNVRVRSDPRALSRTEDVHDFLRLFGSCLVEDGGLSAFVGA